MQMLNLYPRERLPLLELIFRRFFNEQSDESDLLEYPSSVIVKVVLPVAPYDSVHSECHKGVCELVK